MNLSSKSVWAQIVLTLSLCGCAIADQQERVDLIVYGDYVLTMADEDAPLADGAIAIDDSLIVAVGSRREIDARYVSETRLDGHQRAVMPGLVNGHTHAAMTLLRGVADDLQLMEWLTNYIFPAEIEVVDEAFVRVGTQLACWEMIESGTTSFVDMYFFPETVSQVVEDCGLRAVVAPSVIEQQSPDASDGETSLRQATDYVRRWQGKSERIVPAVGAHSVYTISESGLRKIADAARKVNAPIAIHVSESLAEIDQIKSAYSKTPVEVLQMVGMLDQPVIAAHVVHPSPDDIALLARYGVGAIHNPTSNLKLSSGIAPVTDLREGGVKVGLGTDGAASNNDLDLWEEIRLAGLLAKGRSMDPTDLPAKTVLTLSTREGAAAIGLGDRVGKLAVGMRADLIQVDFSKTRHAPLYDIYSHLVYVADSTDVVTTIVDGQVLMSDRQIHTIDESALAGEVQRWRTRIAEALNLPVTRP
ncbi:MAG: amidohydrolase [Pseudomonadota bacterium]